MNHQKPTGNAKPLSSSLQLQHSETFLSLVLKCGASVTILDCPACNSNSPNIYLRLKLYLVDITEIELLS